jgi:hypothetical protein
LTLRLAACGLLALLAASCSQLPAGGPSSGNIVQTGTIVRPATTASELSYSLVAVDESVLDVLTTRSRPSLAGSFGGARGGGTM